MDHHCRIIHGCPKFKDFAHLILARAVVAMAFVAVVLDQSSEHPSHTHTHLLFLIAAGSTQRVLFVDEVIQDEFFELISKQLENVNSFFQAREAESAHKLRDLGEQVEVLQALRGNRRTRPLRSTRNKHHSLKLAMTEFYYNLVLLQNFQQLNHTGFRKVLKKQDKLARSEKGMAFFKNQVCQAYFWKSNKLSDLIATTEGLMIDKLEDGKP